MNWEINWLQMLQTIRNPFLTMLMETITSMVENLFLVSILATLYWCVDKKKSAKISWILFLSSIANGFLKSIFNIPRPFQQGIVSPVRAHTALGTSFPSGHTQAATSFWGGAFVVLKSKKIAIFGVAMVLLTGLTRIYLGVHWPTDVLGGILFGGLSVMIGKELFDENKGVRPNHILLVSILVLITMIAPVQHAIFAPVASLWGMIFGLYLEHKYIRFKEKQRVRVQLYKIIIGMLGVFIIYLGMTKMFPPDKFIEMIKYAITMLWITSGAPFVFEKLFVEKK